MVPRSRSRVAARELAEELAVAHRDTIARARSLLVSAATLEFEDALENEIVNLEEHAQSEPLRRSLEQFLDP